MEFGNYPYIYRTSQSYIMRRMDTSSVRCNAAFRISRDSFILNHSKILAMQPKSTFRKRDFIFKLIPMFLISLSLFVNKVNAQCSWSAGTNYPIGILDQASVTVGT